MESSSGDACRTLVLNGEGGKDQKDEKRGKGLRERSSWSGMVRRRCVVGGMTKVGLAFSTL